MKDLESREAWFSKMRKESGKEASSQSQMKNVSQRMASNQEVSILTSKRFNAIAPPSLQPITSTLWVIPRADKTSSASWAIMSYVNAPLPVERPCWRESMAMIFLEPRRCLIWFPNQVEEESAPGRKTNGGWASSPSQVAYQIDPLFMGNWCSV